VVINGLCFYWRCKDSRIIRVI